MNSLPMHNEAGRPDASGLVFAGSANPKQRGVVLFLTLIALLAMSLAAVALIRSVDTSAMILGNLAFKESAKTSADAGFQGAVNEIIAFQTAYVPATPTPVENDWLHPLSLTNLSANPGYYSNVDPALLDTPPLFYKNPNAWKTTGNGNVVMPPDGSGNTVQYIIQRMCRYANMPSSMADCLFGVPPPNADSLEIKPADAQCKDCKQVTPVQNRITVKSTSSTGAVSYVQSFIY